MTTEIVYGTNPVIELLRARRRRCHEVFVALGRRKADAERVEEEAGLAGARVKRISRDELVRLASAEKNQGICARCDPYPYVELEEIIVIALNSGRKGFILVLDGITDPQNLGSLIRTANLTGVHGVIIPRDNSALVTPAVVKASAGATEHQRIARVTNLSRCIGLLKEKGFWTAAAVGQGGGCLYEHDFRGYDLALVLGSEGRGIRRLVREGCDYPLSIPMEGAIKSYNVAAAGAIFMGEVARQRRASTGLKFLDKSPAFP